MCASFAEPHLPMSFKMAECNCDHTLSHCVTVPGDSERSQCRGDLRHAPDSSSSSFSCHSHWEAARPAATGHCRKLWGGGMLAGQEKPPHSSTKPILTKLTLWATSCFTIQVKKIYEENSCGNGSKYDYSYYLWPFNVFTFCPILYMVFFHQSHGGFTGGHAACNPALLFMWLMASLFTVYFPNAISELYKGTVIANPTCRTDAASH